MVERTTHWFNWRLPCYGAFGAVIAILPKMILGSDIGLFVMIPTVMIAALILLIVLIRTLRQQSLAALLMMGVFCVVSWLLFVASGNVRTTVRWLIHSKAYKAEALAQPNSANGEFKHVEWDEWGFAGSDTVVYLVFDPEDSLAAAAKSHSSGKFSGIPCEVFNVKQLENHWYIVLFYTDTDWSHCNQPDASCLDSGT